MPHLFFILKVLTRFDIRVLTPSNFKIKIALLKTKTP